MPFGDSGRWQVFRSAVLPTPVEETDLPREAGELPADRSWRYRADGAPRALAEFGVVVGFLLLVVPGVYATRSYRRWRRGDQVEPTLPWSLAVAALVAIPLVPLFTVLPAVAVLLAFLIGLPLLVLVGPRH
jgi:hypothetical protein